MSTVMDLKGTSQSSFNLGLGSTLVKFKNNAGALEIKNKADNAYLDFRAKDIIGAVITGTDVKVNNNSITLNADAASTGADWKMLIARPASGMTADLTYILPATVTNGYFLTTDGSGNLSWAAVSSPSVSEKVTVDSTSFTFSSFAGSPVSMFTLPANAVVHRVEVIVDVAFDAGVVDVGISGTVNKYLDNTKADLTDASRFVSEPNSIPVVGTEAIIGTLTGSPTVGSGRLLVHYSIPA